MPENQSKLFPDNIYNERGELVQQAPGLEYEQARRMSIKFLQNLGYPDEQLTEAAIKSLIPGFIKQIKISKPQPELTRPEKRKRPKK